VLYDAAVMMRVDWNKLSKKIREQFMTIYFKLQWPNVEIFLSTILFSSFSQNIVSCPPWATLGIVGTALAMLLMNTLLRHSSAVAAASVTYIIPIFAIMWGVLDNENVTALHLACMGVILSGVYLINLKRSPQVQR
jgi:drug/metabolite transporter (DMT)-like permease